MKLRDHSRRAFTLVELLVATVIISVIMLAVYRTFAAAMDSWNRTEGQLGALSEGRAFLTNLDAELRSAVLPKVAGEEVPFGAAGGALAFFTAAPLSDRSVTPALGLSRLTYRIVPDKGADPLEELLAVERSRQFFSGGRPVAEEAGAVVLSGLKDVEFRYLAAGSTPIEMTWRRDWAGEEGDAPRAVRVEFAFAGQAPGPGSAKPLRFATTIPVSVRPDEEGED